MAAKKMKPKMKAKVKDERLETGGTEYLGNAHLEGYYVSWYMAVFMPLGIILWFLLNNPGLTGVGIVIGLAVGSEVEKQNRNKLKPLTPGERHKQKRIILIGTALLVIFILVGSLFSLFHVFG